MNDGLINRINIVREEDWREVSFNEVERITKRPTVNEIPDLLHPIHVFEH